MTARRRILIVDDETKVAFFLQESLEARGYDFEVVSATSTEEALRQIDHQPFDLLVADQRMPDMNGLELVKWARERHPDLLFILITAYGSEDLLTKARRMGVYRYFTKPFHIEDFVQTVLEALQKHDGRLGPFPGEKGDMLSSRLEELRREVGAQCVLASTSSGTPVAQAGVLRDLDAEQLLRLAANGFAASWTMTSYLKGSQNSHLNYHEGANYDIYTASVHENLFLVIIFDRRVQASRIGIVWLYARRAIESLRRSMTPAPSAGSAVYRERNDTKSALGDKLVSVDPVTP